jgi:cation transport regulator ChaC
LHSPREPQFVFGYGSLVGHRARPLTRRPDAAGFVADLAGFRRTWGVAMDNRRDLPGYKYYTDAGGDRPEVFVAFLDMRPSPDGGDVVNGLCLPVDDAGLQVLDRRERNYERIDVSGCMSVDGARVWAYVGSAAGREQLRRGRAAGTTVIDANYLTGVRSAFASIGEAEYRTCAASLDPGDIPVVALRRHDLP